ncbi:hypothetical protein [Pectobacterium versatile]|uniref:hypothetical protein n=2 Tax=Pectobacterium versatile TaxID=2488639 RepID=UPI001CD04FBD|nr:hypothetical protein [Pectobacterium versatile]
MMNLLRSSILVGAMLAMPLAYALENGIRDMSNTLLHSGENQNTKTTLGSSQYGMTLISDKKETNHVVVYQIENGVEITEKDLSDLFETYDLVVINLRDGRLVPAIHTPNPSGYPSQKAITLNNTSSPSATPVKLYVNGKEELVKPNRGAYIFSSNGVWTVSGLQP